MLWCVRTTPRFLTARARLCFNGPAVLPLIHHFTSLDQLWNLLWWPWIVTSDPSMFTLTLGVASLQFEGASVPPNVVVARAAMAVVPTMIVFAFAQPHIVRGIALTGL